MRRSWCGVSLGPASTRGGADPRQPAALRRLISASGRPLGLGPRLCGSDPKGRPPESRGSTRSSSTRVAELARARRSLWDRCGTSCPGTSTRRPPWSSSACSSPASSSAYSASSLPPAIRTTPPLAHRAVRRRRRPARLHGLRCARRRRHARHRLAPLGHLDRTRSGTRGCGLDDGRPQHRLPQQDTLSREDRPGRCASARADTQGRLEPFV